jgi:hypothetical protein
LRTSGHDRVAARSGAAAAASARRPVPPGRGLPVAREARLPHAGVMSKTRREVLDESKRKGIAASAMTAATVIVGTVSLPVAVVFTVPTAWLGWRWWKHRAENGIKF